VADAVVEFSASVAQYQAELAKIPGMTDKSAAAAALKVVQANNSMTASAKTYVGQTSKTIAAQTAVAGSSNKMALGFRAVSTQLPDVISQLSTGANPMQVLVQQGTQVVEQFGGIPAVVGMVGPAILPVAVAVAAVATAGLVLVNRWQEATQASRDLAASLEAVRKPLDPALVNSAADAWQRFNQIQEDSQAAVSIELGYLDDIQAATIRKIEDLYAESKAEILLTSTKWAKLEVERQLLQARRDSGDMSFEEMQADDRRLDQLREELPAAKAKIDALKGEVAAATASVYANGELLRARKAEEKAVKSGTGAVRDRAREEKEAQDEINAALAEQANYRQQLGDITEKAYQATLKPMDELLRKQELELANVRALGMASGDRGAASEALAAVEKRQIQEVADLRSQLNAEYERERQASADAELRRIQEYRSALVSSTSSFFGGLAALSEQVATQQGEANADAAARWFKFYQGVAIGQIAIDAIVAGIKAVATLGPIAGGIAAVGIAAGAIAAGAQVAAQEMPTYHAGTGYARDPDEIPANLTRGEGVLTRQGVADAGGPDAVRRMNQGQSRLQSQELYQVYRHRVFGRVLADQARMANSPLAKAVAGGRRSGHRVK